MWRAPDAEQRVIAGFPEAFKLGVPLGKIATPQEIANVIAFLASDLSSHIVMQDIVVDGGAILTAKGVSRALFFFRFDGRRLFLRRSRRRGRGAASRICRLPIAVAIVEDESLRLCARRKRRARITRQARKYLGIVLSNCKSSLYWNDFTPRTLVRLASGK